MKPMAKIICGIVGFLFLASVVNAQDLQSVWEQYLQSERQYQVLQTKENNLVTQQKELLERQEQLQQKHSWYNGWIIKMRLSGVSEHLLEVADSLETVRHELQKTAQLKSKRFQQFKRTYLAAISDNNAPNKLPDDWKDQSALIVQSVTNSRMTDGALPDYSQIVNKLYDDESTRTLVMSDLQGVLRNKVDYIDSLIAARQSDLALLKSMADFKKDIQLQSQSDMAESHSENPAGSRTAENGATYTDVNEISEQVTQSNAGQQVSTEIPSRSPSSVGDSENSVRNSIQDLKKQREQYQQLLRNIEKELYH